MNSKEQVVYDIAIIGLGPAGSTFARIIDKKYKVIAIDKKIPYSEEGFHKPCGALLATDAQKSLSKFNLTLPKDVLVDPQIFAVKTIDTVQDITRHYQRFYLNLDRAKFDSWLISLIEGHVEVVSDAMCSKIERIHDIYQVTYKQGDSETVIQAKYVVGADGANSIVRNTFFKNKKIRYYVSIQQWFQDVKLRPFYSCIFDSEVTDCYSWIVSKDQYFIFGGAFPSTDCRKRFEILKDKLKQRGFVFENPIKTEACLVLRPSGIFSFCTGDKGIFLIGEAAGFISPSSLEGISYAFNSADKLAETFRSNSTYYNKIYNKKTFYIRLKLCLKILKSPFMYWPPLRKLVMKLKISNIDVMEQPEE